LDVLEQLGIVRLADRWAATLSYGDQRRLEVARALAGAPRFLLLDEPAAGMNESESEGLRESIQRIRSDLKCGILVVEHDLRLIMRLCDSIYVLNEGKVISRGTPDQVRSDPAVIAAYIGEEERDVKRKGLT
jgi:branched-chain amino acid transport system permease protein